MIFFEFLNTPFLENCLTRICETFRSIIQKLSVVLSLFAKACPNFVTFDRLKKKSKKIHNYSNKFEKWGFGCTISPSSSPHIDAWLRNWLQSSKVLRGYIHLCSRKKGIFTIFFWKNNTIIFKILNVYLFLHVIRSFMNFFKRKYL